MTEENRNLLSAGIHDRLDFVSQYTDADDKDQRQAFKEVIEAINLEIKLVELENSKLERAERLDMETNKALHEEEIRLQEAKKDRILKAVEIGGAILVTPLIGFVLNRAYAKMICTFEKDYTFTTTPGRRLSDLFRFRK